MNKFLKLFLFLFGLISFFPLISIAQLEVHLSEVGNFKSFVSFVKHKDSTVFIAGDGKLYKLDGDELIQLYNTDDVFSFFQDVLQIGDKIFLTHYLSNMTVNSVLLIYDQKFNKWTDITDRIPKTNLTNPYDIITDILIDNDNSIYIINKSYGVFKSTDFGDNWVNIIEPDKGGLFLMGLYLKNINQLFVARMEKGLIRSNDNGASWENLNEFDTLRIFDIKQNLNDEIFIAHCADSDSCGLSIYNVSENKISNVLNFKGYQPMINFYKNFGIITGSEIFISSDYGFSWEIVHLYFNGKRINIDTFFSAIKNGIVYLYNNDIVFEWDMRYLQTEDEDNNNYSFNIMPNPTTGAVKLRYQINNPGTVTIIISNALGKRQTLTSEYKYKGDHIEEYDLGAYPQGIYNIIIQTGDKIYSENIVIIR